MDLESRLLRIAGLVVLVAGNITTKAIILYNYKNKNMQQEQQKIQVSQPYMQETQAPISDNPNLSYDLK